MQGISFSINLTEQAHDRLAKAKQLRAPDDSWGDFIDLICTELESNPGSGPAIKSKAEEQPRQPWRNGSVKAHPLFTEAIDEVKKLEPGQVFTLTDIFEGRWDEVPSPRVFGRLFKQEVESQGLARHVDDDKTRGVAEYERLKPRTSLFGV